MELINAQEMGRLHPDTFEVPSQKELDSIKEGDYVKVGVSMDAKISGERFWVLVVSLFEDGTIEGTVNNDLVFTNIHGLRYDDIITLKRENVYSIIPAE